MMAAATALLLYEGGREDIALTAAGALLGSGFMVETRRLLEHRA
jgi:hypothetical protein